ncbi:PAS domain-containing sensor histidine kinase [Sphingomonas sp. BIUV-7]|uniref:histidine kinase n=1 Tax=Sphingomonas natans TaxID=3063330 RepID=A0ABT8Y990_9SPHN|nr:PAS domain-containing sensor histidine kinase [Sphingomonas sp. BIUV-7]MDO6414903.1 PAS domain-containing sensor histidine kinase [Sphingomonas sp. BIUV-7]
MSESARPAEPIEDFEDLYDSAPCGYLSLTDDGRIFLANRRISQWLGIAQAELIGRRIQDILSVPGRIFYETNISPLLRMQGFVDEVAMDFLTADRIKVPCLVNASERRDSEGRLQFTRLAIFQAAERRRYERALIDTAEATRAEVTSERETSQLREQFIAVLGHDLRNPLASIASGVRLLTDRETLSVKGQRVLLLMQGSVGRASDLIDNVLDFARGRLGGGITLNRDAQAPLTPVLEQVVGEIVSASPERDIRTYFAIAEPIDCDRTRISQLLSNLLGNAVMHGAKTEPILIEAKSDRERFTLSVVNGGRPIGEAAMARLFQPFFRGEIRPNQLGLGLGLHIASEIAKAHEGELTVASDESHTRFTFSMPLARRVEDPD